MIEVARQSDVVHSQGVSTVFVLAAVAGGHRPILTHHLHSAICPAGSAWSPTGVCTAGPRSAGPCSACPRHRRGWAPRHARWRTGVHLARSNICPSHYLESRLGLPRSTTIYNPVHPQTFVQEGSLGPGEHGLIAFAGRPDPVKGLGVLFRALALLPDRAIECHGSRHGTTRTRRAGAKFRGLQSSRARRYRKHRSSRRALRRARRSHVFQACGRSRSAMRRPSPWPLAGPW